MKSNILIKGVSCNVLYLFYEEKVMRTGLERNNCRGGPNYHLNFCLVSNRSLSINSVLAVKYFFSSAINSSYFYCKNKQTP